MPLLIDLVSAFALLVAMPRWLIGWMSGRYRWSELRMRLFGRLPKRRSERPCLWLHAASLGEMNVLLKLLPDIEQSYPEAELVVTTATTSGYQLATREIRNHTVTWFPLAFSWAAKAALRRLQPTAIVLVEMELSPTLLRLADEQGVLLFVVNGRLSQRQQRMMNAWPSLASDTLTRLDRICAQTPADCETFTAFGAHAEQLAVTGSIKFDCLVSDRENAKTEHLAQLAGIAHGDPVMIAGSTKAGEERIVVDSYLALREDHPSLRLIVVPRNANRFSEVAALLDACRQPWQRRSQLDESNSMGDARILLVDVMGELNAWWGLADVAFVGGSLCERGGQNMIEPAAYGAAVCFGPHTENFDDVVSLLLAGDAAQVVRSQDELTAFARRCLDEPTYAKTLGWRARSLIVQQAGALAATLNLLEPELAARLAPAGRPALPRTRRAA